MGFSFQTFDLVTTLLYRYFLSELHVLPILIESLQVTMDLVFDKALCDIWVSVYDV